MSLKVWLPLNGDLENKGSCGEVITSIGTNNEWASNGKIGNSCLHLLKASGTIAIPSMIGAKQMSFAYWVKVNNAWPENWRDGIRWYSTDGSSDQQSRQEFYTNCTKVGVWFSGSPSSISGKNFTVGEWHHLAFTIDYNIGQSNFYIDGNLVGYTTGVSTTHYIKTGNFTIGDSDGAGVDINMNDVRIYDHVLSAAEVKEISQGLVVHYKLDGFMGGANENIILTSNKVTSGSQGTNITREYMNDGSLKIIAGASNGNYAFAGFQNNSNTNVGAKMQVGDVYTISCDVKVESGTRLPTLFINSGNGYKQLQGDIVLNQWIRAYYTSTWAEPGTNYGNISLHLGFSSAIGTYYFKNFKLEKGSNPTPWTPAPEDLGIDTTIIEDSSGYNNYGILNDTSAQYVIDSRRYSQAIKNSQPYNSSIYLIKGECNMPDSDALTFSWWMNPTTFGHQISGIFSTSNSNASDYSTTAANMRDSCFDCCNISGTNVRINVANYLTLNEWHHYALTYNGSQLNFYKDGVSKVTANQTGALKAFKYIYLFYSCAGGAHRCTSGQLSDFRIYCTSLLDSDIKMLYNTNMSIDNLNNIHTFNIEETNNNILAGVPLTKAYGNRGELFTNYNSHGEPEFTANSTSAGTDFIPITPGIYEYDYTITTNAGNMFDIGFERFDKDKTSRSNAACVYIRANTSECTHQHFQGTVDLSTDGVNPCAYIALRVLNGWSGTTSGVTGYAIIHNISLRLQSDVNKAQLTKQGNLIIEEIKEDTKASFHKLGIVEASTFIEK